MSLVDETKKCYGITVFVADETGTGKVESGFSGGTPLVKLMYVIVESPVMTPIVILHEGRIHMVKPVPVTASESLFHTMIVASKGAM